MLTMNVPRLILDLLLAFIGAVGAGLLFTLLITRFVDSLSVERIRTGAAFLAALVVLFLWFQTQPAMGASLRRLRWVLVVEFILFAVSGILLAIVSFVQLWD